MVRIERAKGNKSATTGDSTSIYQMAWIFVKLTKKFLPYIDPGRKSQDDDIDKEQDRWNS
jgi:hypothetical protein